MTETPFYWAFRGGTALADHRVEKYGPRDAAVVGVCHAVCSWRRVDRVDAIQSLTSSASSSSQSTGFSQASADLFGLAGSSSAIEPFDAGFFRDQRLFADIAGAP